MALQAGTLHLNLEYATGLKDKDWFGKQDPFCYVQIGAQRFRSKTATDGGKNPVWNQHFQFQVINENDLSVTILDEDVMSRDDVIGRCNVSLANVRTRLNDRQSVPLVSKSGKPAGTLHVSMTFAPNGGAPAGQGYPPVGAYPPPAQAYYPPPAQAYPPPAQAHYPPPAQAHYPPPAQAHYPPPAQAHYPPPAQAHYPPPAQAYPPPAAHYPQGYPPQPYGYPPAPYGAAPHMVHGGAAYGYPGHHGYHGKKFKKYKHKKYKHKMFGKWK